MDGSNGMVVAVRGDVVDVEFPEHWGCNCATERVPDEEVDD